MLPIYNPKGLRLQDYNFTMDITNNTNDIIDITTDNFTITHKTNGTQVNVTDIFPHDPVTNDPIIITRMNPSRFQEVFKFTATPTIGTAKTHHAGFQVTSQASYTYVQDPSKVQTELEKILSKARDEKGEELTDEEQASITREFMTLDAKRQYHTNDKGEPNHLNFKIETIGNLPVHSIIPSACDAIIERLSNLEMETRKQDSDVIQYMKSNKHKDAIIIKINKEDDTTINIIRHYIYENIVSKGDEVSYIGYRRPHYLKDYMIIKMIVKDGDINYSKSAFQTSLRELKTIYESIRRQYVSLMN
jgi:DNA-directed RNA polymerase subunit L